MKTARMAGYLMISSAVFGVLGCGAEGLDAERDSPAVGELSQDMNVRTCHWFTSERKGFAVFYTDPDFRGFAAHVYPGTEHGSLGSLDNTASSVANLSDSHVCVYELPWFQGRALCLWPGEVYSNLYCAGTPSWDDSISSVMAH